MLLLLRKLERIYLDCILKVSIEVIVDVWVNIHSLSLLREIGSWRMDRFRIYRISNILLQFFLYYTLHHAFIKHFMRDQRRYLLPSTIIPRLPWKSSNRQRLQRNTLPHMALINSYWIVNRRSWRRIQRLYVIIRLLLWGRKLVCKFNHFFGRLKSITIICNRCISHRTSLKISTVSCWLMTQTSLLHLQLRLMLSIRWQFRSKVLLCRVIVWCEQLRREWTIFDFINRNLLSRWTRL